MRGIPEGIALRIPEGTRRTPEAETVADRSLRVEGRIRASLLGSLAAILAVSILAGCSAGASSETNADSTLPDMIRDAPPTVREAYAFAVSHPDVLQGIPCYCGCGSIGHTSNYACYIAESGADGELAYDSHALGCSICIDITRDAIRLVDEGREVGEIRTYIDRAYSAYGPSNMP